MNLYYHRLMKPHHLKISLIAISIIAAVILIGFFVSRASGKTEQQQVDSSQEKEIIKEPAQEPIAPESVRVPMPDQVKALYLSSWGASSVSLRNGVLDLARKSEVNAVIIDIKDYSGRVALHTEDPTIVDTGSLQNRIPDLRELLDMMGKEGIYRIGRVTVFQDPFMVNARPAWVLKRTDTGGAWTDKNGLAFLDPQNPEVRKYIIAIARAGFREGYDEINFDYIRYPSDGNLKILDYGIQDGYTRADNIESFFKELHAAMSADGIHTSADLFGMTTTNTDDLGIGQVFERALPYFDAVAPMVYPSHYPKTFLGYANPASYPYEIVHHTMESAITRAKAAGYSEKNVRTWIQDFNLGAVYTADMVKEQLKASDELGLGWMVWDPANTYTVAAYARETSPVASTE